MANGKLLRQLIKSGVQGDTSGFRVASESVIQEEREKNHHLLANDLERLLYGDSVAAGGKFRKLHALSELPANKDNGLALLEERVVVREEKDIILSDSVHSALDEILMEHNRADVLRSYGMKPAQRLLFCGPPGCGKTLAAEVIAHSLSLPLVLVRLDSVISSFLGETAANLRKVFDYIADRPVVALFDEFDALSKDRAWPHIMADALGHPLITSNEPEASLRGAALVALERLGAVSNLQEVATLVLDGAERYEPNPENHTIYARAIERQRGLYRRMLG